MAVRSGQQSWASLLKRSQVAAAPWGPPTITAGGRRSSPQGEGPVILYLNCKQGGGVFNQAYLQGCLLVMVCIHHIATNQV